MRLSLSQAAPQAVSISAASFRLQPQVNISQKPDTKVSFLGLPGPTGPTGPTGPPSDQITVSDTPPSSPEINDLWIDIS